MAKFPYHLEVTGVSYNKDIICYVDNSGFPSPLEVTEVSYKKQLFTQFYYSLRFRPLPR